MSRLKYLKPFLNLLFISPNKKKTIIAPTNHTFNTEKKWFLFVMKFLISIIMSII